MFGSMLCCGLSELGQQDGSYIFDGFAHAFRS